MDSIFNEVCILVTAAFALTLVPGFRRPERSLLSRRDQGTALLVFLVLGLVEEATVSHAGWLNERIVAVCAAGVVAGPWVGLVVSVFVTWLAVAHDGLPLGSIATAMLCVGLVGGWLYRWRPRLAQHPLTGFCLTLGVSSLRRGLIFFFAPHSPAALRRRLQGLFGRLFQLEVRSEIGEGTAVTMRIPLRKQFGVNLEASRAIASELCKLAPN